MTPKTKKVGKQRNRSSIYPWDVWFRLSRFTLKHGKDFKGLPHAMAQQIRNAAKEYGIADMGIKIGQDGSLDIQVGENFYKGRGKTRKKRPA